MPILTAMTPRNNGLKRTLAIVAVVVLATTSIIALSALFAQSDQTRRVAQRARVILATEELLSATTAERGATAVALLMAESAHRGYATDEQLKMAIDDIGSTAEEVRARGKRLDESIGDGADEFAPLANEVADAGIHIGDLLAEGDLDSAGEVASGLLTSLANLEAAVSHQRADSYSLLIAEEGAAGKLVRATSIVVALLIPGGALFLFRWLQGRRQRRRELEVQLAHERARGRIKDQMIANLSHELRTPLTGIYGTALSMRDEGCTDPGFHAEMTEIIVTESADLSRMVDDLLTAATADNGGLEFLTEDVNLHREITEAILPFDGRGILVDCEPAFVAADRLRFRQVLRNLVSNAVKHGGSHITLRGERVGDRYTLSITDNGPGIRSEMEDSMFDRYVHEGAAPLTSGSLGMGLSIAQLLTRGMGGELHYRRDDGLTSFLIDLPLSASDGSTYTPATVTTPAKG